MHIQLYIIEIWLVQYPFQLRFISHISIDTFLDMRQFHDIFGRG